MSEKATNALLAELRWRGLIHQMTDEAELGKLLSAGRQTIYIGFDPTATSLHVGGLMQLMMLRRFQRAGHRPIALVGGATGMIGDPSGKSEERNLLSAEDLQRNVDGVASQMRRFLDFDNDNGALLLNNFEWMKGYTYLEFLRDVGKNFPIGQMMGKESVRSRLESEAGLSYTEFSYMLLQAYDFVHLAKNHGCLIQAGGSDQWGNITAGIDLGRPHAGQTTVWFHRTAADDIRWSQDGQDRVRRDLARCQSHQPLSILSILAKRCRRRCDEVHRVPHRDRS